MTQHGLRIWLGDPGSGGVWPRIGRIVQDAKQVAQDLWLCGQDVGELDVCPKAGGPGGPGCVAKAGGPGLGQSGLAKFPPTNPIVNAWADSRRPIQVSNGWAECQQLAPPSSAWADCLPTIKCLGRLLVKLATGDGESFVLVPCFVG